MGLGDYSQCRQRMSRGLHGVSGRAALWFPAFHSVHRTPCGTWHIEAQEQARASAPVLEHLRRQERTRVRMECALARLRAELLELRFQNHQLARTLLDLNVKMQQLKKQQDLERASKSQSPEDDAMNPECGNA
uniref:alanine and arginine-rich domain-containing protein n=1 Tax=Myodes glareolus TaxID=447135 RepID=UPI0020218C5E|nr:alanine and arginine-rich domain-containing protein [Myodes glareolus]